ncbi:hypothetical protein [Polaribacter marinaquae]|uniref:Uncharacterized protein n=1 Tax=Polaribacter marinaquae TaxID=1642819 RepID=A0ABZ2TTN6_9FLAO
MKKILTFEDILNSNNFLKLQNTFKSYDDKCGRVDNYFKAPQIDDFNIVFGGINTETGKNVRVEEFFYKDYLIEKVKSIYDLYLSDFNRNYKKLKLSNGNISLYYRQKKEELISYFESLDSSTYLPIVIKESIEFQLSLCLEKIQDISLKDELFLGDKLNFKVIRQDVLVLFYLLREKGHIKWHSNSELKVILENNFMSYDLQKKKYVNFKVGRSVFSDFKNGTRPINQSIERLKKIFLEDNFFDIT